MHKLILIYCSVALLVSACGSSGEELKMDSSKEDSQPDSLVMEAENTTTIDEMDIPTPVVHNETEYLAYGINRSFMDSAAVSVDDMYNSALEGEAMELTVYGECTEICQMAGCWIEVAKSDGDPVFVKFKDHFTLPIESTVGKKVLFHGLARIDTTSVEMQRHYLDDRAKSGDTVTQEEYDAITEPEIGVSFLADGILVEESESK